MHELSLASAILQIAQSHLPDDAILRRVHVRAGAMRAIEPEAMRWAWLAVTDGTPLAGSQIALQVLPWRLTCPSCGRRFEDESTAAACPACGDSPVQVSGSDELQVVSLDVDDVVTEVVR